VRGVVGKKRAWAISGQNAFRIVPPLGGQTTPVSDWRLGMAITPFEETLEVTIRDGEDVGYSEPSSRVPLRKLLVVRHVSAAFF
jgi:hypothetical protein